MDNTEYYTIHPQVLRIDSELPFNVYLKVKDGYSRLIQSGKKYTALIHIKIFKYSISSLYIEKESLNQYYKYLEDNFEMIFMDMLISIKSKAKITYELITHLAQITLENPKIGEVTRYKKQIKYVTNFVFNNDDGINHLLPLTSTSYHEFNHLVNVGIYGLGLLKEVIGNDDSHNNIEIANGFFLHDIGYYSIPKEIIGKAGKLTDVEWNTIKKHPLIGYEMLRELGQMTEEVGIIIMQHHERHNGMGYPKKILGDQIHIYSKICTIADTFDALTAQRPYRKAQSSFVALKTMQTEMNQDFDPKVFAKFVLMFSKSRQ